MEKKKLVFQEVYEVVRLIPYGRVTTYGAIAEYLGVKSYARMVGWAMNAAHDLVDVPAHRVVNGKGELSGQSFFEGSESMQQLLEREGIQVKEDKIVDFRRVLWNPTIELKLD